MKLERTVDVEASLLTDTRVGAIVTLTGADGQGYRARIVSVTGAAARVRPFELLPFPAESPLDIVLVQALPKKEKMEFIIQKATELGVNAILPCVSSKSITASEREQAQVKAHRWPQIARKAVEQSRRRCVPEIAVCTDFIAAIGSVMDADLKIVLYEKEKEVRMKDLHAEAPRKVALACGPEGGFTEEEVLFALKLGYRPVSLGSRILRCETATIAALSIAQFLWGDI